MRVISLLIVLNGDSYCLYTRCSALGTRASLLLVLAVVAVPTLVARAARAAIVAALICVQQLFNPWDPLLRRVS